MIDMAFEQKHYGCDTAYLREYITNSLAHTRPLIRAQEEIGFARAMVMSGRGEINSLQIEQALNRALWIINTYCDNPKAP